jgi:5-formyltetrahydrofolate cyclo-ligase
LLWFESNDLHRHMRVTPSSPLELRRAMRAQLRTARASLPRDVRVRAAAAIVRHLLATRWFAPGKRVALYVALRNELDLLPLMRVAERMRCEIYLPRIENQRRHSMRFVRASSDMRRGPLGIFEPTGSATLPARFLHLVILPTLGVDKRGVRLGYGAGYYDRVLAFRRQRTSWRGPRLVAAAFDIQRVAVIPAEPHDVPVDRIVTESGMYFAERNTP